MANIHAVFIDSFVLEHVVALLLRIILI
jgi:hypothetical protein